MKSLIKYFANTKSGIFLRNITNIKPVYLKTFDTKVPISISDAFAWRTDNGFKTKFKYSDILELFYNIKNTWVEIHIFSKNNILLKKEKILDLKSSNEFTITKDYLEGIEDYGVFYIYHFSKEKFSGENIISNRCYLGYSKDNNLYSFVHGNTLAKYTNINPKNSYKSDMVKMSFFKDQIYHIQKYFENFDKNELFFSNPTSKTINFSLENKNYILKEGCSVIIETSEKNIIVKSNCYFLRPTVFSYKNNYIDVHHS